MSEVTAAETIAPADRPAPDHVADVVRGFAADDGWLLVAGGITLAGAAYPVLIGAGIMTIGLWISVLTLAQQPAASVGLTAVTLIPTIASGMFFAVLLGSVGLIWGGFFTVIVVPIFYLFARSLQLRANIIWLGAICGGLVGFLAVLPLWLQVPFVRSRDSQLLVATLIGPGLATICGQIGGAWGGWRAWRDRRPADVSEPVADASRAPLMQFQIRHLMWITVWLALMLTAIRLSGIAFELILPVLLGWLIYQAATLYLGSRLVFRMGPRWFSPQGRRST